MSAREIAELSFVSSTKKGRRGGRCFWDVQPVDGYTEQWRQGEELALEALAFMAEDGNGPYGNLLVQIGGDMPNGKDATGVEYGFLECIGVFATAFRQRFGDDFYRRYRGERRAHLEATLKQLAAERSERGRKAARARWKKHKRRHLRVVAG